MQSKISAVRNLARLPPLVQLVVALHGVLVQVEYARHTAAAAALAQARLHRRHRFGIGPCQRGLANGAWAGFRHPCKIVDVGADVQKNRFSMGACAGPLVPR